MHEDSAESIPREEEREEEDDIRLSIQANRPEYSLEDSLEVISRHEEEYVNTIDRNKEPFHAIILRVDFHEHRLHKPADCDHNQRQQDYTTHRYFYKILR